MALIIFILGTCLGSFYLVIGKRLPQGLNAINDRSRCDHCGHQLAWYDLVPIFSYVFLRGKCRYCKKTISPLNLIVELTMGLLFTFAYLYYDKSYDVFMFMVVSSLMMIIFISDFSYFIILDSPLVVGGILILILKIYYLGWQETGYSILAGFFLFFTMLLIKVIGDKMFNRESLGGGDIKFSFIMGLCLGTRLGLCALILSTFLALPYSFASLMLKKNNEVPYGPFLASSLFVVFAFTEKFLALLDLIFISL
jgi:leader peptidase (prepilin peptidase)/N-methyltransferase